jgi:hypothetical protein
MEDYDVLCSVLYPDDVLQNSSVFFDFIRVTHGHYSSSFVLKKILKRAPLSKRNPFALFSTFSFSGRV